jgi:signal peptidase I
MRKSRKRALTGFSLILLFILAFALFFNMNFRSTVVVGDSMEPTFSHGRRLLVSRAYWLVGPIQHKDIVVIKNEDGGHTIKRVYRKGGEVVDWYNVPMGYSIEQGEFRVPDGMIYVLGDNRENSEDSRTLGPVPLDRVVGKVVIR